MNIYDKATDYYLQALSAYRKMSQGADTVYSANVLNNIGVNYSEAGFQRFSPQNPQIKFLDYCEMQLYSEADPLLNQSLSMYEALSNSEYSSHIADILCNLAVCDLYRGDKHSARHKFKSAYSIYLKVNQTNQHVHIIETYLSLTTSDDGKSGIVEKRKSEQAHDGDVSVPKSRKNI